MDFPSELKYTATHEWVRREGKKVTVGINDYAQKEISDVVFVEVPKEGALGVKGKPLAVVESVKAAFDIYAPVSGKVLNVNGELEGNPGLVNHECYGEGWFFEIEMSDESEWGTLMDVTTYQAHLKTEAK